MVELKTLPTDAQMAQFLGRVRWLSMGRHIIVTSFGEDIIAAVRAAAPDLHAAIIDNPGYRPAASVLQFGRTYVVNAWSVTAAAEPSSRGWRHRVGPPAAAK
jgi:hypothetical protein